ncbi:MAG: tyrosine-type recombinase/integrase [Methylocystis sp.]
MTRATSLSEPVSFHELRHTYASHAVMNGMPLMVLAGNLGHSDARMVEKHYGHMSDEYRRLAVQKTGLKFESAIENARG